MTTGLARELVEEIGLELKPDSLCKVQQSDGYDTDHIYYLYHSAWQRTPTVTLSWEHSRYEWLSHEELIARTGTAIDHYMHMVHDYLTSTATKP